MDYFAELADFPDTDEALARVLPDVAAIPDRTVRRRETMRRFYGDPSAAVDVWRELRYCHTFRHTLVDEVICACERKATKWDPRNQAALTYLDAFAAYDAEPRAAGVPAPSLKQIAESFVNNPIDGREAFIRALTHTRSRPRQAGSSSPSLPAPTLPRPQTPQTPTRPGRSRSG
jgi:hypothetical protein